MENRFIPEAFKEKIVLISLWLKGFLYLALSIILFLSIFSFSITDSSFLTTTSSQNNNILGSIGSYLASFIIYSFGVLGYFIVLFYYLFQFIPFPKKIISIFL